MIWQKATLKDLVFLQRGFDITKAQQKPGDVPVISSSGVKSHHAVAKVEGPGIVIGRKGTLGSVFYSEQDFWPHDTTLWSKDLHGNNPRFIFYFLKTLRLENYNVGNANPTLNRNHIHDLEIRIPDRPTQDKIADILSAYDDLIENNRRRMALLEESARLLYREWFVHLRFPGHEHVPITDGVPEGWERKKIGDVSSFLSRGITPKYDGEAEGLVINQKCIRNNRVTIDLARKQSKEVPPLKLIQKGDVLINSTGEGTLGRVAQLWVAIENCTVDSHVTIVRPKEGIPVALFGASLSFLEDRISQMGRGATNQTELSRESLAELTILLPPKGLVEEFDEFASDTSIQISNLSKQTDQLKSARDILLPRLMNGELAV